MLHGTTPDDHRIAESSSQAVVRTAYGHGEMYGILGGVQDLDA